MLVEVETALLAIAGSIVGILMIVRRQVLRDGPAIYRSAATGSAVGFLFCAYHVSANHAGRDQLYIIGFSLIMAVLGVQGLQLKLSRVRPS